MRTLNKTDGKFSEEDEALFRVFVYQTTIAVENFQRCGLFAHKVRSHAKMTLVAYLAVLAVAVPYWATVGEPLLTQPGK